MRYLLIIVSLAVLAGCESTAKPRQYEADQGMRNTAWGGLHVFDGLRPLRTVPPEVPAKFKYQGFSATVIATVLVEKDGTVTDANIEKSSGSKTLDDAVVQAVKKWKYAPREPAERLVTIQSFVINVYGS